MADSDIEGLAKSILGETTGLTPSEGDAAQQAQAQDRLWSVVAYIAQSARTKGLLGQMRRAGNMVPADETDSFGKMKTVAETISKNRYAGPTQLPKRAALWQISTDGYPLFEVGKPPAWIFASGVAVGGQFKDRNGLLYRLYESANEPEPGRAGFVSSYSSSGLSPPTWSVPQIKRTIAWALGAGSAVLFVLGGAVAIHSGQGDGAPRAEVRLVDIQYRIVDKLADACIEDVKVFPNWKRSICAFLADDSGKYVKPVAPPAPPPPPGTAAAQSSATPLTLYGSKVGQTVASIRRCLNIATGPEPGSVKTAQPPDTDASADERASCELVARSAAEAGIVGVSPPQSFLDGVSNSMRGIPGSPNTRSILAQMLAMTIGIAGLAIALGLGTKGRVAGIWIDERNRISLARAQVTLWTIVSLGGFATTALYNVGLAGPIAFPQIPASIAAALGIAFASPMLSALILNAKALAPGSSSPQSSAPGAGSLRVNIGSSSTPAANDPLETRAIPSAASLADVFVGEHVSDAGDVDISRLQNVVLTVTLVLGYFAMLVGQLGSISADTLLTGIVALPDPGAVFTSVLLVSHATYLGTKAYNGSEKTEDRH